MGGDPWRDLVDLGKLRAWMDDRDLGGGPIKNPTALAGGTQNILLRFERDGRSYVLRRSPRSPRGDGNATNHSEARVLGALTGSDVPHPGLIAACSSTDVIGAAFYLMEPVKGFNATVALPPLHAGDAATRRRMGFATWPEPDGRSISGNAIVPWDGFPRIEELLAHYASESTRETSHMRWYGVLGCYKLGIILEGTHARACAGVASKLTGDRLHGACVTLFQRALGWLERDKLI